MSPIPTFVLLCALVALAAATPTEDATSVSYKPLHPLQQASAKQDSAFVGGVYAMSNNVSLNKIAMYGQNADGTLTKLGFVRAGGRGAVLNSGSGVDPLISAFSLIVVRELKLVLACNAGGNSIAVFAIQDDYTLTRTSVRRIPNASGGVVSLAYAGRYVYAAVADVDGEFDTPAEARGMLTGFYLTIRGRLLPLKSSDRMLSFRPSAIQFAPNGLSLLVSSVFAPMNAAVSGVMEEMFSYQVWKNGRLSMSPLSIVSSTAYNNSDGRNLPTAIGFDSKRIDGLMYLFVSEVRNAAPDGMSSVAAQTSSVSVWRIAKFGRLTPVQMDVPTGTSVTEGQQTSCWLQISGNGRYLWTANTGVNSLSSFRIRAGMLTLSQEVAATPRLPIDIALSANGRYLYQLMAGGVAVYRVERMGLRGGLTFVDRSRNLPRMNAQGVAAY